MTLVDEAHLLDAKSVLLFAVRLAMQPLKEIVTGGRIIGEAMPRTGTWLRFNRKLSGDTWLLRNHPPRPKIEK